MKTGMMWMDDSKRPLPEKVAAASVYYAGKYGRQPDTCFVAAGVVSEETAVGAVTVKAAGNIPANYLWLGVEDS